VEILASAAHKLGHAGSADAQEVIVVILTRTFVENSHVFSRPQQELWSKLGDQLPEHFILYGDTALGLRMGHRGSPDFELKSSRNIHPDSLLENVAFLRDAQVLETRWNHLKVAVGGPSPVEMTFDGGQTIAQIHQPARSSNGLAVASLADLAGEKMHRISERPTAEDYRDIGALLYEGTSIDEMMGCAKAMYGEHFDPAVAVKNLTDADRPDLHLDQETQSVLIREGAAGRLPALTPIHSERITTETQAAARKVREQPNSERPGLDWER
jgi:hypothetical protein